MSHLFKLMRENVSEAPLEPTKDADAISDELERIKKEEAFFAKLLGAIASINKTTVTNIEAELGLWDLLRVKGSEWKDQDFDQGAAVCKTVQACNVVETQRQKASEAAIQTMETKLQKWSRDEVKSARAVGDSYSKLHRLYSNSSHKVNQINRDKKVQLSDLAVAEKKRDDLLAEFEKEGRVGLQSLQHIYDKSKSTLMVAISEYVQARLDTYQAAVMTLTKVHQHVGELIHFANSQEALQQSSVRELQSTIQSEARRQHEINNAPRSLHPSLLNETAAMQLYMSRCSLSHSWEAKREGKSGKITVGFDIRTSALTIGDFNWHVEEVLTLTKAHKSDSTKVKISFHNRDYKDEGLSFFSTKDREAFYELFCLLRRGLANSFTSVDSMPVTHEEVKIWTGSWNMGDAPPDFNNDAAMQAWMPRNKYDFYVLSLQESEYTPRSGYLTAEDDFFSFMRVHLGDEYLKLAGVSLQHIRLVCFVCRDHYHKISSVKTATVATGLAGVIGNKGGCGISFSFYDARFCFVGSHLAARIDRKRLEARNQNYRDILKGLAHGFSKNGLSDIHHEFDYLVWLGDLNYRIDGLSRDEIIAKAAVNDLVTLQKHDQLNNERALLNCFLEFEEPPIKFGPTYRFNRGDRTWSEEKMREPAYCDRVLYKTLPMNCVKPYDYLPCHELMTSDHSPIYSILSAAVYLPAMPHIRDPMCKVSVKDVIGHDLRGVSAKTAGQYSLILQAPWLSSHVTTSANSDSDTPRWSNEIPLYPVSTNRTYLASRWFRCVVRDERKQDVGQGIIYLADSLKRPGEHVKWVVNLVDKGRYCGKLTGIIQVSFSPSYEEPWPFNPNPAILPTYFNLAPSTRPHASGSASIRNTNGDEYSIKAKQSQHVHLDGENEPSRSSGGFPSTSPGDKNGGYGISSSSSSGNISSNISSSGNGIPPGPGSAKNGGKWASSRVPTSSRTPPMPIGLSNPQNNPRHSAMIYGSGGMGSTGMVSGSPTVNNSPGSPTSSGLTSPSSSAPLSSPAKFMVTAPARSNQTPVGGLTLGSRPADTSSSQQPTSPGRLNSSGPGSRTSVIMGSNTMIPSSIDSKRLSTYGVPSSTGGPPSPSLSRLSVSPQSNLHLSTGSNSSTTSTNSATSTTSSNVSSYNTPSKGTEAPPVSPASSLNSSANSSFHAALSEQGSSLGGSGLLSSAGLQTSSSVVSPRGGTATTNTSLSSSNPALGPGTPPTPRNNNNNNTSPAPGSIRSDWLMMNSSAPSYSLNNVAEDSLESELQELERLMGKGTGAPTKSKPNSEPGKTISAQSSNSSPPTTSYTVPPTTTTYTRSPTVSPTGAPIVLKPNRSTNSAPSRDTADDIARELAEFEMLLGQRKGN